MAALRIFLRQETEEEMSIHWSFRVAENGVKLDKSAPPALRDL
jgi:hypothetical protein